MYYYESLTMIFDFNFGTLMCDCIVSSLVIYPGTPNACLQSDLEKEGKTESKLSAKGVGSLTLVMLSPILYLQIRVFPLSYRLLLVKMLLGVLS